MIEFEIYTDGSSKKDKKIQFGGYAYIITTNGGIIHIHQGHCINATNNQMEMTAILESCRMVEKICEENGFTEYKVTIYSDSAYCINCYKEEWYINWIKNGWKTASKQNVLNKELWQLLVPYFEKINFDFRKVAGHSDNALNNYVDRLAQKEAESIKNLYLTEKKENENVDTSDSNKWGAPIW